jgi:hypothetical protein
MGKFSWQHLQKQQTKKYLLKHIKPEVCLAKQLMDSEEKRTGVRPKAIHIVCPCSKCQPYFM